MSDHEREFRLRPGKPKVSRSGGGGWTSGFRTLMHYARQSRGARRYGSQTSRPSYRQRCAVRITYCRNSARGQWRAHGRYLERENAACGDLGFDARQADIRLSTRLQSWQASRDELMWKLIISPEFGDRADLRQLTRDVMRRVEEDLGKPLEWVAVVHTNTEHPHIHVALRGADADGQTIRLSRDYVKRGVREIAEELCTRQMGFRTTLDGEQAERREIDQRRVTSLDRAILRNANHTDRGLSFALAPGAARPRDHNIQARLMVLSKMGLAKSDGYGSWLLRSDTEQVL